MSPDVATPAPSTWRTRWASPYVLTYLALYGFLLGLLHHFEHFDTSDPLLILATLGVGFSVLAYLLTRHLAPLPLTIRRPGSEVLVLLGYTAGIAAYLAWGRTLIDPLLPLEPMKSVVILVIKLQLFVFLPMVLFRLLWGYRIPELVVVRPQARQHWQAALWMSLALILFQCVLGSGWGAIRQSGLSLPNLIIGTPLIFLFLMVEVGLVEEFFFRTLLQSRLSAWLKSEIGGIVVMSLLFGLAHAPGLYYRSGATQEGVGPHPSWLLAIGYSIAVTSVAGFFLGVLWARTRNLLLVMIVHAAGDLVPNLVPMVKVWH
jgi:membrane protease YdiL (CAAX protease family)